MSSNVAYSEVGRRLSADAGILSLMDDLGNAMARGGMIMMGGGNPGQIPEIEAYFKGEMQAIIDDPDRFRRLVGIYDPPSGDADFRASLAALFNKTYGWPVTEKNVALTNGSQSAFFMLFNLFGGVHADGRLKPVLLPVAPEYIGYADVGVTAGLFTSIRPEIQMVDDRLFKYRLDTRALDVDGEIGAVCVSRPTNPTGNVLTDAEMMELESFSASRNIPLIVDNAYGLPFPGLIYSEVQPVWNEQIVLCMSLSKLGLPAVRTGIVVASEAIIRSLSGMNAVLNLAPGSMGAMIAGDSIRTGKLLSICADYVKPYYEQRARDAVTLLRDLFDGMDAFVHTPEGAMFLWLWFKDLPVSSLALYERLKARGVLVVSGHYFFPGLENDPWPHKTECIRVTYSQNWTDVMRGLEIIAEEVKGIYKKGR
ncbi:MAG: valine--pyruvate transaminase [Deltaproteobacteria bacterium]|nr:MAG: valine--pyruvate transaminase [Deltaproteobacteria bacterium]